MIARARAGPRAERAHVQETPDAHGRRGVEHVEGGLVMHRFERDAARAVLADDPHQVDDHVAPGDRVGETARIQHVALDPLDRFETAQVLLRTVADQASHDGAVRPQRVDHR